MLLNRFIDELQQALPSLLLSISLLRLTSPSGLVLPAAAMLASWMICGQGLEWSPGPLQAIIITRTGISGVPPVSLAIAAVLHSAFFLTGFQEALWRHLSTSMIKTAGIFWAAATAQFLIVLGDLPTLKSRMAALAIVTIPLAVLHFKSNLRKLLAKDLLSGFSSLLALLFIFWTEKTQESTSAVELSLNGKTITIGLLIFVINAFESAFYTKSIVAGRPNNIFLTQSVLNFFCAAVGCPFFCPLPRLQARRKTADAISTLLFMLITGGYYITATSLTTNSAQHMGVLALVSLLFRGETQSQFLQTPLFHRWVVMGCLGLFLLSGKIVIWFFVAVSLQLSYFMSKFSTISSNSIRYSISEGAYRYTLFDELALVSPYPHIQQIQKLDTELVIVDCRSIDLKEFRANIHSFEHELRQIQNKKILIEAPEIKVSPQEFSRSSQSRDFLLLPSQKVKF